MQRSRLDWSDKTAVRRWLNELDGAYEDAKSVVEDMLAPRREQHLGHMKHLELWSEHSGKMDLLIASVRPELEEPLH